MDTDHGMLKPEMVQQQLERMLLHPLFKNSKRCQLLLRHLVEIALRGDPPPKERMLGIEVFGCRPDYDTNEHPIVRSAASDIRKRIAQYYFEPEHNKELHIELPAGTYLPRIYEPDTASAIPAPPQAPAHQTPERVAAPEDRGRLRRLYCLACLGIFLIVGIAAYGFWPSPNALDSFWAPLLDGPGPILINNTTAPPVLVSNAEPLPLNSPNGIPFVSYPDTSALVHIVSLLSSRHADFVTAIQAFNGNTAERFISPTLTEMRTGQAILIGNSEWTLHLLSTLHFCQYQDTKAHVFWIADRKHPKLRKWHIDIRQHYESYTKDYAIITRIQDPATKKTIMVLTGLGYYGTAAAAEFVTTPSYMALVADKNSPVWHKKNIQIVISTKIVGTSMGPLNVLAKDFW